MRQRKSWARSSSVGALKLVIRTPCGSTSPMVWRSTPPLPLVSMPCSTTSTRRSRPDGPLGPEPLLQVGELVAHRGEGCLAVGLLAVEAGRRVGLDRGQVDRTRRQAEGVGDGGGRHGHIMAHPRTRRHAVDVSGRGRPGRRAAAPTTGSRSTAPWSPRVVGLDHRLRLLVDHHGAGLGDGALAELVHELEGAPGVGHVVGDEHLEARTGPPRAGVGGSMIGTSRRWSTPV